MWGVQKRCRACSLQPLSSGKKSAGKLLRARGLKSLGLHGVRAFFVGAESCCRMLWMLWMLSAP